MEPSKLNFDALKIVEASVAKGEALQREMQAWQTAHSALLRSYEIPLDGSVELMTDGTLKPLTPQPFRDTAPPQEDLPAVPYEAPVVPADGLEPPVEGGVDAADRDSPPRVG